MNSKFKMFSHRIENDYKLNIKLDLGLEQNKDTPEYYRGVGSFARGSYMLFFKGI